MELLRTALVIIFLATASARPFGRHHHKFRKDRIHGWLDRHHFGSRFLPKPPGCDDSSSESDQSSESRESSESSENQSSEESSEEVPITDQTTAVMTTNAVTTVTEEEGSAFTPEPDTESTDEPTVTATLPPATSTTPVSTSTCNVTQCFTVEIPTEGPITDNRGDN